MLYTVLPVVTKSGLRPTNFALDGLGLGAPIDTDGTREVTTKHPFGTHRVRINDGDSIVVRSAPDPEAFDLTKFRGS